MKHRFENYKFQGETMDEDEQDEPLPIKKQPHRSHDEVDQIIEYAARFRDFIRESAEEDGAPLGGFGGQERAGAFLYFELLTFSQHVWSVLEERDMTDHMKHMESEGEPVSIQDEVPQPPTSAYVGAERPGFHPSVEQQLFVVALSQASDVLRYLVDRQGRAITELLLVSIKKELKSEHYRPMDHLLHPQPGILLDILQRCQGGTHAVRVAGAITRIATELMRLPGEFNPAVPRHVRHVRRVVARILRSLYLTHG